MLTSTDFADVVITLAHPWGDVRTPLEQWIKTGPWPRPYVEVVGARRISTGEEIPLAEIPKEYHNSPEARRLQREGLLPCPWGPPPDAEPGLS